MYSNNFIINYDDYINYYRICFWNISRKLKMIMQTNLLIYYQEWKQLLVKYILFLRHLLVLHTMKYSKNDKLIVYKSQ